MAKGGGTRRLRTLIVVDYQYPELVPTLQARFGPEATVILDRRRGERRRARRPVALERRKRRDRRRALTAPEEALWVQAHYRVAYVKK